jgi:hypothetical protein
MGARCRNCGQETTLAIHLDDDRLLKCAQCAGFQFVGPVGNVAELYTEEYYNGAEYINYALGGSVYRRNFLRKLRLVQSQTPELPLTDMRVLEIGSATGDFLRVLEQSGVQGILGVEASEYSRKCAQERGFEVIDPFATDYFARVKDFGPNIICAWDVWEHLEQPGDVFSALIGQNPGIQVVALSTVNSGALVPRLRGKKWRQFHPPTHLNYPTRKSFELYFQGLGFKVVANEGFGYYRPLADYLSIALKTETLNSFPWLFKIPFYLNLFDIQMVLARPL